MTLQGSGSDLIALMQEMNRRKKNALDTILQRSQPAAASMSQPQTAQMPELSSGPQKGGGGSGNSGQAIAAIAKLILSFV